MTEPTLELQWADQYKFEATGEFEDGFNLRKFYVVKNIEVGKEIIDIDALVKAAKIRAPHRFFNPIVIDLPQNTALKSVTCSDDQLRVCVKITNDFTLDRDINGVGYITGGAEPNVITVKGKINIGLCGGGGKDTLIGGDGENSFYASEGDDIFIGGSGDNEFIFQGSYDNATIQHNFGNNVLWFQLLNPEGFTNTKSIKPEDVVLIKQEENLAISFQGKEKNHHINILNFFQAPDKFTFKGTYDQKYNLSPKGDGTYKFELASK